MTDTRSSGSTLDVFLAFLWLGLTSFGGPIAHLGYFRSEFVSRRRWLDEQHYAELVALCQFLPGPASSQVGFSIGLLRAGYPGAFAAWVAFTLPSAIALGLFALGASWYGGPVGEGILGGLKIVAVSIVAHAVWGMARNLCPDGVRTGIALVALWVVLSVSGPIGQVSGILLGILAGILLCRSTESPSLVSWTQPVSSRVGMFCLGLFALLLIGLPALMLITDNPLVTLFDAFYRAGALVFGGGHVVLPLLHSETVAKGWIGADEFLSGYGAAQAIPGPLFTFAAYLGALVSTGAGAAVGAGVALIAVFTPGILLLVGILPFWQRARQWPYAQAGMRGANASVVGILGAALYTPVWTGAVNSTEAFALALTGFILLTVGKLPAWTVVLLAAIAGVVLL